MVMRLKSNINVYSNSIWFFFQESVGLPEKEPPVGLPVVEENLLLLFLVLLLGT